MVRVDQHTCQKRVDFPSNFRGPCKNYVNGRQENMVKALYLETEQILCLSDSLTPIMPEWKTTGVRSADDLLAPLVIFKNTHICQQMHCVEVTLHISKVAFSSWAKPLVAEMSGATARLRSPELCIRDPLRGIFPKTGGCYVFTVYRSFRCFATFTPKIGIQGVINSWYPVYKRSWYPADILLISLISGCWIRLKHGCFQQFFKFFTLWPLSTDIWLIFRYIQLIFFKILPTSVTYLAEFFLIFCRNPSDI